MKKPAIFLDKDGTLVRDIPYNVDPQRIDLEPGVADGLRLLQQAGYLLVVVSNQSGVARGLFPETALIAVEERLRALIQQESGACLDGFYYCPHHPQGIVAQYAIECACRKPGEGLLLAAAEDLDIDLDASWMIGDILNDVEAGHRAGCRTILIDNGNETEWKGGPQREPDYYAANLADAADYIVSVQHQSLQAKCGRSRNEQ